MRDEFPVVLRSRAEGQAARRCQEIVCSRCPATSTVFGNPFRVDQCREAGFRGTDTDLAHRCVEAFRVWLGPHWRANWDGPESEAARAALLAALPRLRGKNLACWCRPGAHCHADVLLDIANRPVCEAVP